MVIKMKNGVIPYSMWVLFAPTFLKHLPILGITEGKSVMKRAKAKYRSIIKDIPSFGKNDILLVNLLSAAQIAAVYLSLDEKPPLEQVDKQNIVFAERRNVFDDTPVFSFCSFHD